jgi:uncharacterized small protein (DUF1192 family)
MESIQNFFIFCSGSNRTLLNRTPTDLQKHVGVGATIFFTGLFAAIACSYALYTVFNSYFLAILVGLVWGLMIFNLDRYIVSSLKMTSSFAKNFGHALPRLILAIIISIVIAKPLELKIFETEIDAELSIMRQENKAAQEALVSERFQSRVDTLDSEIERLKTEINTYQQRRDALMAIAISEADGTGGSQQKNLGPIYKAKKVDADKAQTELDDVLSRNLPLIDSKAVALSTLKDQQEAEISALEQARLTGFASRLESLHRLAEKSSAIHLASIFIMLLFIAIETAPLLVKLISTRSPYDFELDKHEHVFVMNHTHTTSSLKNKTMNQVEYNTKLSAFKTQVAIDTEKRIIKDIVEESYSDLKNGSKKWKNIFSKREFLTD